MTQKERPPKMTREELLQVIEQAKRENATSLNLSWKGLTELPPEIGQLTTLRYLDLSINHLTAVPSQIGRLTALTTLVLSNNQLKAVPPEIGQLTALTTLVLSGNQLTTLPPQIGQLTALTDLYLSDNKLTTLPPQIGQLTSLTVLILYSNYLTAMPPQIGQLTALTGLFLESNQLTAVPPELLQLTNLKELDLRDNPLPIPPEILNKHKNDPAILAYIRQNLMEKRKPLHEAKMLVLGQASVGKTSLIRRLTQGDYDPHERITEGIAIHHWPVPLNGNDIQLNIWDFGGQEIMHATHQFFLTKRSLYLLVLDCRANENDNRLEYWLQIIASFGGDSPIIVVGNKSDQRALDIDKRGLRLKYPAIKAIVETSCATGAGIAALQAAISQELATLPHIHDQLPASWFALKEKLAGLGRDYLPYDEYTRFCHAGQIGEAIAQTTLLGFLHDLGVVLHFRDDPRLEEMSILNPLWVTQAVYKILNHRPLAAGNGLLTRDNLHTILDSPAYPRAKQMYILEMLRKFELCYELEGQRDTVLLPDLLPKEQPDLSFFPPHSSLITHNSSLSFQYHYNVLPGSIISRFIVRLHPYIHEQVVWRSGVLLAYQENFALVRADSEAKQMSIGISGPAHTRRIFLAIIRSHFEAIHRSLPGLHIREMVALPRAPHIIEEYQHLLRLEKMGQTAFLPRDFDEMATVREFLEGIAPTAPEERGSGRLTQRRDLLETLSTAFKKGEIRELCFALGVDYEELDEGGLKVKAMSLIETMERNGRLTELLILVQEQRPKAKDQLIVNS